MKDHNYTESDIQKYILGEFSQDELEKFESTMNTNPDFALEVERQIKLVEGIAQYGAQKFKNRLKNIYQEVRPEIITPSPSQSKSKTRLTFLLLFLILLLGSFFIYKSLSKVEPSSPQEIYASYFERYDWNPNLRSDSPSDLKIEEAIKLYNNESYPEAIPLLETIIEENPNQIPLRLAIANCYIESQNPELAFPHLDFVLNRDDVLYQQEAKWYLGLAYLKSNQIDYAKVLFEALAKNESSDHQKEAEAILQRLE